MKYIILVLISLVSSGAVRAQQSQSPVLERFVNNYMPLAIDSSQTGEWRWKQKPVMASRVLDDMESVQSWKIAEFVTKQKRGRYQYTTNEAFKGLSSVKFSCETKGDLRGGDKGRPWELVCLTRQVKNENWSDYNRVSVHIKPDFKGFRTISLALVLFTAGEKPLPDWHFREGIHFITLQAGKWNEIQWEIAHLDRKEVTGLGILYSMKGNEPEAADTVHFYVDQVELQKVQPDVYKGWQSDQKTIIFSHTGYESNAVKTAFTSDTSLNFFALVDDKSGKTIYKARAQKQRNYLGVFNVFDFSSVKSKGSYKITSGNVKTKPFRIGGDIWKPSVWKSINFLYCERCGTDVPGIHGPCHLDWQSLHGGLSKNIAGGWHDAGDVSQSLENSAETVQALFELAEKYKKSDTSLYKRLITEGEWGLQWVLNNRFPDGYRSVWTTIDFWTDNINGTVDDPSSTAILNAFSSYKAVLAEAGGAMIFRGKDSIRSAYCLHLAEADYQLANANVPAMDLELAVACANAAIELYKVTHNPAYVAKAIELADYIISCQQHDSGQPEIALSGFFFRSPQDSAVFNYSHHLRTVSPVLPLVSLCEMFNTHPNRAKWYDCVKRYADYLKKAAGFSAPYFMVPASVYRVNKKTTAIDLAQIKKGMPLGNDYYLRFFPVWGGYRGNLAIMLGHAITLANANRLLHDPAIDRICTAQLEWTVGKNPFDQSLMYGEGYNYASMFAAFTGDMVGEMPVGIKTLGDDDIPYWTGSNCFNQKEVWVVPTRLWLSLLAAKKIP